MLHTTVAWVNACTKSFTARILDVHRAPRYRPVLNVHFFIGHRPPPVTNYNLLTSDITLALMNSITNDRVAYQFPFFFRIFGSKLLQRHDTRGRFLYRVTCAKENYLLLGSRDLHGGLIVASITRRTKYLRARYVCENLLAKDGMMGEVEDT